MTSPGRKRSTPLNVSLMPRSPRRHAAREYEDLVFQRPLPVAHAAVGDDAARALVHGRECGAATKRRDRLSSIVTRSFRAW
jgi:hypothetical protein